MKLIHVGNLPKEKIHEGSLTVQRVVKVGESVTNLQTFNRAELPPGASMAAHTHPDCEELFYFLSGNGEMVVDGARVLVTNDDVIVVAPAESHEIKNNGNDALIWVSFRILK